METVPLIQCIGCHCDVCTGTCLAAHRDRYCCHNPRCIFHAPCPAPPEPGAAQPTGTSSTTEQALVQAITPSAGDAAQGEGTPAPIPDNSNVIYRETVIREWRLVEAVGGPVTGRAVAFGPTTASVPSLPAPATTVADATSSAHVDLSSTSPARFTIEEYEAQARLLAQFQQPQQHQQGQRSTNTGSNGRGQGARTRPTVRIQFN